MRIHHATTLSESQKAAILELWNSEFPKKTALADVPAFEQYLQKLSDRQHLLLLEDDETLRGWMITFSREEERFFVILLHPSVHGQGWGSRLLDAAKAQNAELNGWVVENEDEQLRTGAHYRSPIAFYEKNGFEILRDVQLHKGGLRSIRVRWRKG